MCQSLMPWRLLTCSQHLLPACPISLPHSLPQHFGPELRSEHVHGIKETTGLGLRVCATPAWSPCNLILPCYKLKRAPPLHTVRLCVSQAVQKRSLLASLHNTLFNSAAPHQEGFKESHLLTSGIPSAKRFTSVVASVIQAQLRDCALRPPLLTKTLKHHLLLHSWATVVLWFL